MEKPEKDKILNAIDYARESAKNSMEIFLENYTETMSKLDFIAYSLLKNK